MTTLREKYKKHRTTKYSATALAERSGGREMVCCVCGKPYQDNIADDVTDIICAHCTMGMSDAYDPSRAFSQAELIRAISDRKLKQFRIKYNLTQADLGRLIGISSKQVLRYENSQYSSIDSLIQKVSQMGGDVTSSDSYPSDPQKGDMAVSKNQ